MKPVAIFLYAFIISLVFIPAYAVGIHTESTLLLILSLFLHMLTCFVVCRRLAGKFFSFGDIYFLMLTSTILVFISLVLVRVVRMIIVVIKSGAPDTAALTFEGTPGQSLFISFLVLVGLIPLLFSIVFYFFNKLLSKP